MLTVDIKEFICECAKNDMPNLFVPISHLDISSESHLGFGYVKICPRFTTSMVE